MMQELGREELPQRLDAQMEARIGAGQLVIPVLPAVASTVLGMIDDPDAEIARLAHTIQHDPAIAGHVMRIANSASLRGGAPIVSLQQAITRLGMRSIADIALAACMGPKLFNAPRHAALLERIWSESLATALWSREIARTLRRNVEVAFLSGLMHQIGKPVLLQALQEMLPGQGEQLEESLLLALLERHAAAAGLAVATHWGLPEPVAETIAHLGDFSRSAAGAGSGGDGERGARDRAPDTGRGHDGCTAVDGVAGNGGNQSLSRGCAGCCWKRPTVCVPC